MKNIKELIRECGFDLKGFARISGYNYNTLKAYSVSNRKTPEKLYNLIKEYQEAINSVRNK